MTMHRSTLIVSAKSHSERERVIASWASAYGDVLRLDQFWAPPSVDTSTAKLYGAIPFCLDLSSRLKLSLVSPPDDFLLRLSPNWVGRRIWPVTLRDAVELRYPLFLKSVRPKLIKSGVYSCSDELMFQSCGLPFQIMLMAAELVEFLAEYRLFVLHGEIVTYGLYMGDDADAQSMLDFAGDFVGQTNLPETCVVDVGRTIGGKWVIVEVNPVWGAGLRGCHPDPVARCIAAATRSPLVEA